MLAETSDGTSDQSYCTDGDFASNAVSGTVIILKFSPGMANTYTTDVEATEVVLPSLGGGSPLKIVSAHLYF